jgi:hypothetical protein
MPTAAAIAAADFLVTYTCDVIPNRPSRRRLREFLGPAVVGWRLHGTNSVLRFVKGQGWEAPRTAPEFMSMVGSQFSRIRRFSPIASRSATPHPLVAGLEPFEADDELYLSEYHGENHALLHTHFRGEAPGFVERHWPRDSTPRIGSWCCTCIGMAAARCCIAPSAIAAAATTCGPMMREYPHVERGSWKLPVYHESCAGASAGRLSCPIKGFEHVQRR